MGRLGLSVFVVVALAGAAALAQSAPPDPLQPGAAAASDPKEAAPQPAAAADAAKPSADKRAPRRARPKHAAPGALTVTINNKRSVGLVELDIGPTGGALKKVQGALAFGRKSVVHVPRAQDCLYDIRGQYADEADMDQTAINLCKDRTINLTDE